MKAQSGWQRRWSPEGVRDHEGAFFTFLGRVPVRRLMCVLWGVSLLTACAGPEKTFRDAHDVVTEVIDLTVDVRDPADAENLYALEERVETACRPIFKNAHRQWVFGDIPFYSQLETLVSTHQCRRSVDEARRWLDAYHIHRGEPAERPVTFSN